MARRSIKVPSHTFDHWHSLHAIALAIASRAGSVPSIKAISNGRIGNANVVHDETMRVRANGFPKADRHRSVSASGPISRDFNLFAQTVIPGTTRRCARSRSFGRDNEQGDEVI